MKKDSKKNEFPDEATRQFVYTKYFNLTKKGVITKSEYIRSIIEAYLDGDLVWRPQAAPITWGYTQHIFTKHEDGNWYTVDGEKRTDEEMQARAKFKTWVKFTPAKVAA